MKNYIYRFLKWPSRALKKILSPPKKGIKVMKVIARTSIKIHKSISITVCGVNDHKQLLNNLKLDKAEGHELQLITLVNSKIKILTQTQIHTQQKKMYYHYSVW